MKPRIFFDAGGQEDNLGDTVLRRVYFEVLQPHGEIHLSGEGKGQPHSAGYLAAFSLRAGDRLYASRREWLQACRRLAGAGDVLTLNTGESLMGFSRRHYLQRCHAIAVVRLRGGVVLHCGHGLRHEVPAWRFGLRAMLAPCRLVTWRDRPSRTWAGCGSVYPDWAFAAGQSEAELHRSRRERRDLLVLSLRGDRPPPDEKWCEVVEACARARGLRLHVAAQVRRDEERAVQLAARFGAGCLRWDDADHPRHEARVRALYRRAALIVSDRLHALIIAMTEGAVPVGYTPNSAEKISRSFEGAGMAGIGFAADGLSRDEALARIARLEAEGEALFAALAAARRRLAALSARIAASFASEGPTL